MQLHFDIARVWVLGEGEEVGSWMELLVFIIIFVFWSLTAIFKNKQAGQKQQEIKKRKSDLAELGRDSASRSRMEERRRQIERAAEQLKQQEKQEAKRLRLMKIEERVEAEETRARPMQARVPAKHRDKVTMVMADEPRRANEEIPLVAEIPEISELSNMRLAKGAAVKGTAVDVSFESGDDLRKAILYHEIFGRPVGLRPPSQGVIGL